jgi:replicative DNA helicase
MAWKKEKPKEQRPEPARGMPNNLEVERALLGSVLLDNTALDFILADMGPEDMYSEAHKLTLQRMVDLAEAGKAIDIVTLSENLSVSGFLEKAGGAAYLAKLTDGVPIGTSVQVSEYVAIVKEKSTARRLIGAASAVIMRAQEGTDPIEAQIDTAQSMMFDIGQQRTVTGFETPKQIFKDGIGSLEKMMTPQPGLSSVLTGFEDFDAITGGWRPGDLIILAARPGMGKTALSLNAATNITLRQKRAVGMFSLEMMKTALVIRILCAEAKVDSWRVRRGIASREDWAKMTSAMPRVFSAPLYIEDTPGLTMSQMRAKARRLKAEKDICLLIVDYLQLIKGDGRHESRAQEVSAISHALKGLAKELKIPILALCQMNRDIESRNGADKRPKQSDLRESGDIEADADIITFLYRKAKEDAEGQSPSATAITAYVAKQRDGPTGEVTIPFQKRWVRFVDWIENEGLGFDSAAAVARNDD